MLELLYTLPDDHLAEILIERPLLMNTICIGVSMELYQIEEKSKGVNYPLS
jgi:hypothetical protein